MVGWGRDDEGGEVAVRKVTFSKLEDVFRVIYSPDKYFRIVCEQFHSFSTALIFSVCFLVYLARVNPDLWLCYYTPCVLFPFSYFIKICATYC